MTGIWLRGRRCILLLLAWGTLDAASAEGQNLLDQILVTLPAETRRVEYVRPAELRRLAAYPQFRGRFLGPRLREMDGALSRLGIEENDIDEVVLGWTPRQPRDPWAPPDAPAAEKKEDANERTDPPPTELSGLLAGRFDQVRVSESAANNGLASIPIGAVQAYCPRLKAASVCLVVLSESLAAFGEPGALNRLLEVRAGKQNSLGVDHNFNRLINEVDKYAPIWGIATGTTVPEWFLGWMPGPTYAHVDLKKMFDGVQAFTYSIAVGEKLDLTARLNGETVEVAQRLRQFFSGLRILLSLFWQAQSPSQPSPFAGLEVSTEGRVCALRLTGTIEEVLLYQNSPMHSPVPGI